jgi:tetratricopeptide (TPR) repeat protein
MSYFYSTVPRKQREFVENLKKGFPPNEEIIVLRRKIEAIKNLSERISYYDPTSTIIGKLGEEAVSQALSPLVSDVNYTYSPNGDGGTDLHLKDNEEFKIQVKTAAHSQHSWNVRRPELEQNDIIICVYLLNNLTSNVLLQEYRLGIIGYIPTKPILKNLRSSELNFDLHRKNLHFSGQNKLRETLLSILEQKRKKEAACKTSILIEEIESLLDLANHSFDAGDFTNAIRCYSQCLNLDRESIRARIGRADSFRHLGDFEAALEDCNQAIFTNKRNPKSYEIRGWCYVNLKILDSRKYLAASDDFRRIGLRPWEIKVDRRDINCSNLAELVKYHRKCEEDKEREQHIRNMNDPDF